MNTFSIFGSRWNLPFGATGWRDDTEEGAKDALANPNELLGEADPDAGARLQEVPYSLFYTLLIYFKKINRYQYLSKFECITLAREAGITETNVRIWFQNRRMKQKKAMLGKLKKWPDSSDNFIWTWYNTYFCYRKWMHKFICDCYCCLLTLLARKEFTN